MRTATKDTAVRTVPVNKGESVYLSYVSATATRKLVPRRKSVELDGEPELISAAFVGGLKHLPIRYAFR